MKTLLKEGDYDLRFQNLYTLHTYILFLSNLRFLWAFQQFLLKPQVDSKDSCYI